MYHSLINVIDESVHSVKYYTTHLFLIIETILCTYFYYIVIDSQFVLGFFGS